MIRQTMMSQPRRSTAPFKRTGIAFCAVCFTWLSSLLTLDVAGCSSALQSRASIPAPLTAPETSALKVPRHVAIIPDGHRRYAKANGINNFQAYHHGIQVGHDITEWCNEEGINTLTWFALSEENLVNRDPMEVAAVVRLIADELTDNCHRFISDGVQVRIQSLHLSFVPAPVLAQLRSVEERTAAGSHMVLNICINYGSRSEVVGAALALARDAAAGLVDADALTAEDFERRLLVPDAPDLVVRTGGNQRMSNFLLYQSAYSEFYSSSKTFPEFDRSELRRAMAAYAARQRNFGH